MSDKLHLKYNCKNVYFTSIKFLRCKLLKLPITISLSALNINTSVMSYAIFLVYGIM